MPSLSGLRIVVTRAAHQAEDLAAPLRERGAEVLLVPVIGIAPPLDPAPLREAAAHCNDYDWIVFSSSNAVEAFAAELPAGQSCSARIATVGAATWAAAERKGLTVHLVPEKYVAESLVEALGSQNLAGKRVLIPSAAVTREVVPPALRELGAQVEVVEVYRNVIPAGAAERAKEVFREPLPDWVTFASSSAVENTVQLVGIEALQAMKIASIGPVTTQTIRHHGLQLAAEANPHSIEGLVKAICSF
jgi:uroporphyrinogen III methyltransferase/synthase